MSRIGYSKEWLDLGIVDENDIQFQIKLQHDLQDFNDEHMRYKSLIKFVNETVITKQLLDNLIKLLDKDPDKSMIVGFYLYLLNYQEWSDEIFSIICQKLDGNDAANRAKIIREFRGLHDLSELTVVEFIDNDKYHRILVECLSNITLLEKILERSNSKKIKNVITKKIIYLKRNVS